MVKDCPTWGSENVTPDQMRRDAMESMREATGEALRPVYGYGSRHCFQIGRSGPIVHLFTNTPTTRSANHRVYFFGNSRAVWDQPDSVLFLQCGLDFPIVVKIDDWCNYLPRMGKSQNDSRINQHIHWKNRNQFELRERFGFRLPVERWVCNFDALNGQSATGGTPVVGRT